MEPSVIGGIIITAVVVVALAVFGLGCLLNWW